MVYSLNEMAKKNNVRHKPALDQQKNIDRHIGEGISSKDFIVLNDGKIGINLPENIIGELGSIDPEVALDLVGGIQATENLEAGGYGEFGGYGRFGGDLTGGGHLRVKDEITGGGYLKMGGNIDGGGYLRVKDEITGGGYIKMGGGGTFGGPGIFDGGGSFNGDLRVSGSVFAEGEYNIFGNTYLHEDVFIGDDFLVSGDSKFLDSVVMGDPYDKDIATFSGSDITLGARDSGVLAEFDDGIKFYERPTVSGTGVLLIGEVDQKIFKSLNVDGDGMITGDLRVGGDLFVSGDTFIQSVTDVSVTGDISGYNVEGKTGIFDVGTFDSGSFNRLSVVEYLGIVEKFAVEKGITASGFNVLTEADTGVYNDLFYPKSNPEDYITRAEVISRFNPPPPDPFCFFYDAENNNGKIEKTYYPQRVANRPDVVLSGITVREASDLDLRLRFHGPNYAYAGTGFIDEVEILPQYVNEYGTGTRAFNGEYRGNFEGHVIVTGEANGRKAYLTIEEIGDPPIPLDMYIDSYSNSTPKAGEQQGASALKSGDKINVFAEFDNTKSRTITVLDSGICNSEIVYYNTEMNEGSYSNEFTFEDIGGGRHKATMEIVVSELIGDQGFAIKTTNKVLDQSEGIDSISLSSPSGIRLLDQIYPTISAQIDRSRGAYKNSLITGLYYDITTSTGSNFAIKTDISDWNQSTDFVNYSKGFGGSRDRYNLYNNASIGTNSINLGSAEEVVGDTGDFGDKVVEYKTGFHSEEILRISGFRAANGASDILDFVVPIENGPQIINAYTDDTPNHAQSPNIIGDSEIKGGDKISGFAYIATKGIIGLSKDNNPQDFKDHIEIKLDDDGITDGKDWFHPSTVEHYCKEEKAGTQEERVMFGFNIDVTSKTSRDNSNTFKLDARIHTDGNEANISSLFGQDTIQGSNNYINKPMRVGQSHFVQSSTTHIYKAGVGGGSSCNEYEGRSTANPREVNNGDVPALHLSGVDYPINQSGLKNSETGTINFEKNNIDTLHIDDNGLGGAGQLNFSDQNQFNNIEFKRSVFAIRMRETIGHNNFGTSGRPNAQQSGTMTVVIDKSSTYFSGYNNLRLNWLAGGGSFSFTTSGTTLILNVPMIVGGAANLRLYPSVGAVRDWLNTQIGISAVFSSAVVPSLPGLHVISHPEKPVTQSISTIQVPGKNGFDTAEKDVSRLAGSYNVSTDNFTISGTKTSNGLRTSISGTVNIANVAPTFEVKNLSASILSEYGKTTNEQFFIQSNQQLHRELNLALDPLQDNQPSLSITQKEALPTNKPNNFTMGVVDQNTRGQFQFMFTGSGIGGQEVTTLDNPNYTIGGFKEREIFASHQSLAAGLAELSGVTVQDPNDINMENVSKGGAAANGGTIFTYKNYSDGVQVDNSFDFVNKFTTTNAQGLTTGIGATHIFNLDKNNRAANAVPPGAKFIVRED